MKNRFYRNVLVSMILVGFTSAVLAVKQDVSIGQVEVEADGAQNWQNGLDTVSVSIADLAHLKGFDISIINGPHGSKIVQINLNDADIDTRDSAQAIKVALIKLNLVSEETSKNPHDLSVVEYAYRKTIKNIVFQHIIDTYNLQPQPGTQDYWGILKGKPLLPEQAEQSRMKISQELKQNLHSWYQEAVFMAFQFSYGTDSKIRWHQPTKTSEKLILKNGLIASRFQLDSKGKVLKKEGISKFIEQSQEKKKEIKKGDFDSKKESSTPLKEIKLEKSVTDISKTTKIKNPDLVKDEVFLSKKKS